MFENIRKDKIYRAAKRVFNFFFSDDTNYYAASLSFFTIFSLFPIIALLIAIVSSLPQFDSYLDIFVDFIFSTLNPTHSQIFIDQAMAFIQNSDKLGAIGIFYMLFVFVMFFRDYDHIVNKIHQTQARPLHIAFFFYLALAIAVPVLCVIYFSITSLLDGIVLKLVLSLVFNWMLFFILFKLSINKPIDTKVALSSSLVAVVVFAITKYIFIYYVTLNKTYTTLYGSLAILLFFFFWIYISWIIYLYGIKLCHKLDR